MIRPTSLSRAALIVAINRRTSCPAAFDISALIRRTSVKLFIGGLLLQHFQRGNEDGVADPEDTIHAPDMPKFVGVCQSTLPRLPEVGEAAKRVSEDRHV